MPESNICLRCREPMVRGVYRVAHSNPARCIAVMREKIDQLQAHGPMDPSTLRILTTDYPEAKQKIERMEAENRKLADSLERILNAFHEISVAVQQPAPPSSSKSCST
jgi:hypothetical protein